MRRSAVTPTFKTRFSDLRADTNQRSRAAIAPGSCLSRSWTIAAALCSLAAAGLSEAPAAAQSDPAYLDELVAEAEHRDLAGTPEWRALVHYGADLTGGGLSGLVDNPKYYSASSGKTDPRAELVATLASFFAPMPTDGSDAHAQCRRPARFRWLKEILAFDRGRLTEYRCPAFDEWLGDVDPGSMTLIFPAAFLNNPSSMFGHTLVRIDPPQGPADARLVSYTIHFAADHHGEEGAVFAVKGLAGGYRGYFSLLPYYEKVTQYSDIENRDIWEYELTFTPDEIRRLLENLWELNQEPIDYYFFSTNCSYVLLSLINVARPALELTRKFPVYAVPVDTVRALTDEPGLVRGAVFRPSLRTRIGRLQALMPADHQRRALDLAEGTLSPDTPTVTRLPSTEQARVLELAESVLRYRRDTGALSRGEMAPRAIKLLHARARLTLPSPVADTADAAPPRRPEEGHLSARVAAGVGMTGERPFAELRLRAVYHDLLDPPAGFVEGAAIELFGLRVRQYGGGAPLVEEVTAVAIQSLSPRDEVFRPLSWKTWIGMRRLRENGGDAGDPVASLEGSAGPAWRLGGAIVSPQVAGALYGDQHWPATRIVGIGPAIDLVWPAQPWWTLLVRAEQQSVFGSERTSAAFAASIGQGFRLAPDVSWRLEAGVRNDGDESFGEWSTSLHWYF
ncbi:MAG: DUF4105 domain-containing protein [Defluviicoccus sp.]